MYLTCEVYFYKFGVYGSKRALTAVIASGSPLPLHPLSRYSETPQKFLSYRIITLLFLSNVRTFSIRAARFMFILHPYPKGKRKRTHKRMSKKQLDKLTWERKGPVKAGEVHKIELTPVES